MKMRMTYFRDQKRLEQFWERRKRVLTNSVAWMTWIFLNKLFHRSDFFKKNSNVFAHIGSGKFCIDWSWSKWFILNLFMFYFDVFLHHVLDVCMFCIVTRIWIIETSKSWGLSTASLLMCQLSIPNHKKTLKKLK